MTHTTTMVEPADRLRDRHPHLVASCVAIGVLVLAATIPLIWTALNDKHTEGRWTLTSSDASLPLSVGMTITVEGNRVQGEGPCNDFGAAWSQDEGISDLGSTAMGCVSEVFREEERYFALLDDATSIDVQGDRMTLDGPRGELVFTRAD